MCSKIQEETKEEILAEKNNLDQNMELEDGGTQQQLSRNLQGQKTNKNYANFYTSQLPSPNYSQISQGSNLYSEFQSANSESLMPHFEKLYKFMENISDDISNIKRHQTSALSSINVLTHDMNQLSDDVIALK